MSKDQKPHNLEQLLDRVCQAPRNRNRISLDVLLKVTGGRSFGALLLIAGLVLVVPLIGDIPGVSTAMGILVLLAAGQLLFGREHVWLPQWLLKRSVTRAKLFKAVEWLQSPAQFIDRFLKPRLTTFTNRCAQYVIAAVCAVIATVTPFMEVVPFSAMIAGAALSAFGLSLIAHDGVLALLAFAFTAVTFGMLVLNVL
jgi:hypothetical protein